MEKEIIEKLDEYRRQHVNILPEPEEGDMIARIALCGTIMNQLVKDAKYAQRSKSRDLLMEVYGKAEMARELKVIGSEEFMEINHMTVYYINTHPRELH